MKDIIKNKLQKSLFIDGNVPSSLRSHVYELIYTLQTFHSMLFKCSSIGKYIIKFKTTHK